MQQGQQIRDYGEYGERNKPLTAYAPGKLASAIASEWGDYLERMQPELQKQLRNAISLIRLGVARKNIKAEVDSVLIQYVEQAFKLDDDALQNLGEGIGCQQGRHLDFDYIN